MIFNTYSIFFLTLVFETFSYDEYNFEDLSTLGQRIREDVNRQLAPLQDLGARISASVENGLKPLRSKTFTNTDFSTWTQVRSSVPVVHEDIPKLKPQALAYSSGVHTSGLGLENLGSQIQQSVYESLAPVRAMEITAKMKGGIGGITIVTHLPKGKKFINQNYRTFTCSGSINEDTGECSESLTPFEIKDRTDYCYSINSYSVINDKVCIGADAVSVINNDIKCESYSGRPAVLMTIDEYNKLCQGLSETLEFRYIANLQDPMHVQIPNENKYVKCTNNQPGVCVFTVSHVLPQNGNVFIGNNVGMFSSSSISL